MPGPADEPAAEAVKDLPRVPPDMEAAKDHAHKCGVPVEVRSLTQKKICGGIFRGPVRRV